MKIFIDNGHGLMTAGKRSPDGVSSNFASADFRKIKTYNF